MNSILLILVTISGTIFAASTCGTSEGSSSSIGVTSTADYWKGVDGAQFIEELSTETYDQFTLKNRTTFVMIYTQWCGQAKKAKGGFAGAAKELNKKVAFGAIDCEGNEDVCEDKEHPVKGIPTFYLFKNGKWNDQYKYDWTTKAFVSWLKYKM